MLCLSFRNRNFSKTNEKAGKWKFGLDGTGIGFFEGPIYTGRADANVDNWNLLLLLLRRYHRRYLHKFARPVWIGLIWRQQMDKTGRSWRCALGKGIKMPMWSVLTKAGSHHWPLLRLLGISFCVQEKLLTLFVPHSHCTPSVTNDNRTHFLLFHVFSRGVRVGFMTKPAAFYR